MEQLVCPCQVCSRNDPLTLEKVNSFEWVTFKQHEVLSFVLPENLSEASKNSYYCTDLSLCCRPQAFWKWTNQLISRAISLIGFMLKCYSSLKLVTCEVNYSLSKKDTFPAVLFSQNRCKSIFTVRAVSTCILTVTQMCFYTINLFLFFPPNYLYAYVVLCQRLHCNGAHSYGLSVLLRCSNWHFDIKSPTRWTGSGCCVHRAILPQHIWNYIMDDKYISDAVLIVLSVEAPTWAQNWLMHRMLSFWQQDEKACLVELWHVLKPAATCFKAHSPLSTQVKCINTLHHQHPE